MLKLVKRMIKVMLVVVLILAWAGFVSRTDNRDSYMLYEMRPAVQKSARELSKDEILLVESRLITDETGERQRDYGISWLDSYHGFYDEEKLAYYAAQRGAKDLPTEWPKELYVVYSDLRVDEVKCMTTEAGNVFPYYWGPGMPSSFERVAGRIMDVERRIIHFCLCLDGADLMTFESVIVPILLMALMVGVVSNPATWDAFMNNRKHSKIKKI